MNFIFYIKKVGIKLQIVHNINLNDKRHLHTHICLFALFLLYNENQNNDNNENKTINKKKSVNSIV